ncbi:MAG: translation elongation factor Ts [Mycoplasma sp.]
MTKSELIKALRVATQAGMADCMKALEESGNDLEAAQKWLREKGIAKANKKAGAVAYEGVVKAGFVNNKAVIIEVNCQTDFTAQNDQFVKLANDMFNDIAANATKTGSIDAETYTFNGKPLKDAGIDLTAIIGEKIAFRRGEVILNDASNTVATYTHSNNRVASVVVFKGKVSEEVGKDVAMHIAAMSPKYLNESCVEQTWLASEKEVLHNQFLEELKEIKDEKAKSEKEKRAAIIVEGKVKKLLKDICLVDQPFVKDNSKTVAQFVKENGSELLSMFRFELGEGIEKVESNFAEEVAAQMGK